MMEVYPSSTVNQIKRSTHEEVSKSPSTILALPWHDIPEMQETGEHRLTIDSALKHSSAWSINEIMPYSDVRADEFNRNPFVTTVNGTKSWRGSIRSINGQRYGPLGQNDPQGEDLEKMDVQRNNESAKKFTIELTKTHIICCVTLCPTAIILIILFSLWAITFLSAERRVMGLQNLDISSTSINSHTTTDIPRSFCTVNPSIRFDDIHSPLKATELLPNWKTPVLDLCHDSETTLIITEPLVLNDAQEIRCPERVTGLIIFVALTDIELQAYLNKFCQITKISFVGDAVCRLPNDTGIRGEKVSAKNLQAISFEDLENCAEFYRRLGDSLLARRLTTVAFKCTSFRKEELRGLEYFFRRQEIPRRVKCSNENGCVDLDLSVNRQAIVEYHVVSCI